MFNIHDEVLALIKENQELENNVNKTTSDKPVLIEVKVKRTDEVTEINKVDEILNYSKKQFFKIVDNRSKNGALWVYHDSDKNIHAIYFERLGMRYKRGRGWWIK